MGGLTDLSSEQRNADPYLHIDPGFINYRKCFSVFGEALMREFEAKRRPGNEWPLSLFNDHLLVDLVLRLCREFNVKTLGEAAHAPQSGAVFCSTERLAGNEDVYEEKRVRNRVLLQYEQQRAVELEFHTRHFVADTGKFEQSKESTVSIIGQIYSVADDLVVIHPLIMGAPTFDHPWNKELESKSRLDLMWYGYDWFETFPEDIDEFCKMRSVAPSPPETWMEYMKRLSEDDVKARFCEILGDPAKKDWGGEQDDHFSTSLHLDGRRVSSAFVFKGPAHFREMTLDLLGKRADQVYRVACTPAQMLVVQHCHTIGEAVRATVRAFAVAPHCPRRYCIIDGKDTYRLFEGYGKL